MMVMSDRSGKDDPTPHPNVEQLIDMIDDVRSRLGNIRDLALTLQTLSPPKEEKNEPHGTG